MADKVKNRADSKVRNRIDEIENKLKDIKREVDSTVIKHGEKFNRLEESAKRSYTYPNFIIGALTIIIIAVGFFSVFNVQSEINRLGVIESKLQRKMELAEKDLRNEITAAFEKGKKLPEIVLLSDIETPLEGQVLTVNTSPPTNDEHKIRVNIPVIFNNVGKGSTEPIFVKIYFTKDMFAGSHSSDEKNFAYETYFSPEKWPFESAVLPAGCSTNLNAAINIKKYNEKIDKFSVLIKAYYGGESIAQAKFFIKLSNNSQ